MKKNQWSDGHVSDFVEAGGFILSTDQATECGAWVTVWVVLTLFLSSLTRLPEMAATARLKPNR